MINLWKASCYTKKLVKRIYSLLHFKFQYLLSNLVFLTNLYFLIFDILYFLIYKKKVRNFMKSSKNMIVQKSRSEYTFFNYFNKILIVIPIVI